MNELNITTNTPTKRMAARHAQIHGPDSMKHAGKSTDTRQYTSCCALARPATLQTHVCRDGLDTSTAAVSEYAWRAHKRRRLPHYVLLFVQSEFVLDLFAHLH